MILAVLMPISIGTIALTELVKLGFSLTIGALVFYARTAILQKYTNMRDFATAAKKGLELLGSDAFKKLPDVVDQLNERVERLEKFVGPNGGKSILDGVNSLRINVRELQDAITAVSARDKEIVDALGVLMWKSDENGRCIWASKSLQELVGYTFDEGFHGDQWENLYFPEDYPGVRRRWEEAIAAGQAHDDTKTKQLDAEIILSMRTRYRHGKTGKAIPVYFKAMLMPDGSITGIVTDLSIQQAVCDHGKEMSGGKRCDICTSNDSGAIPLG